MKKLAFASVALLAACGVPLPAGQSTAKVQFVCSMIGATSPGYKYEYTRDGDKRTRQYATVPGSQRTLSFTVPQRITEIEWRMASVRPIPGDGFISCSALCMACGTDPDVPNPEAGKCGPTKGECKIHLAVVLNNDSYNLGGS